MRGARHKSGFFHFVGRKSVSISMPRGSGFAPKVHRFIYKLGQDTLTTVKFQHLRYNEGKNER